MKKILASALVIIVALPLTYCAAGYTAAYPKAGACEEIAFREAVARKIHGVDFSGQTVTVERSAVVSSVSPFAVEVTYSVPRDMHITVFTKRFHISPFGQISPGKLEVFYAV
jgi:hypothetical protein